MIRLLRTDAHHPDFKILVAQLDATLEVVNGDEHDFFDQYNKLDAIQHAVLVFDGDVAVGCGAIKEYAPGIMEVKRMFVPEQYRGKGIAKAVLRELEVWAKGLGYTKCIMETAISLMPAVQLYKKSGYQVIPNYGQYEQSVTSICFEKNI